MLDLPKRPLRKAALLTLSATFVGVGVLHLVKPEPFETIVPPQLPVPGALVAASGAAEVLGGLGVLPKKTRRLAGWGIAALLVAVFPANLYMALDDARFGAIPTWMRWARLPLQLPLIGWALWATRDD
jgi:uncharacterized membrane protein